MAQEPITCPLCSRQDYIGNRDLDSAIHKGFTIGRGKTLYFMMTWHNSGHATVYREHPEGGLVRRYVDGGSMITIHFKDA